MKKKNGFTLIELLAVIIILGVIMLIAIPSVTKYINESRKDSYVDTAKQIVNGAISLVNSGDLDIYDTSVTYYIPSTCINLESGGQSPFGGNFNPAYVLVTYDNESYNFYWMSRDDNSVGVKSPIPINKLSKNDIITGVENGDVSVKYGIDGRDSLIEFTGDCSSINDETTSEVLISHDGEVLRSQFNLGDYFELVPDKNYYIIDKTLTGGSSNNTIYPKRLTLWRVININSDGTTEAVSEYASSEGICFSGAAGYINSIDVLQTVAAQYAKEGYTVATRMMGYNGQTPVVSETFYLDDSNSTRPSGRSSGRIDTCCGEEYLDGLAGDTLYFKDVQLVKNVYLSDTDKYSTSGLRAYNSQNHSKSRWYWLASRTYETTSTTFFRFGIKDVNDHSMAGLLIRNYQDGWVNYSNSSCNSFGVRPIITLSSSVKIDSGEGSIDNPYQLK